MPVSSDVANTTHAALGAGKLSPEQRKRASQAISRYMKEPGMERSQVIAKSLSMARRGQLGERGGYVRKD